MIVDAHTHIFPDCLIAEREHLISSEPVFAELYASPRARMATAGDLLQEMAAASVDHAIVCGFTWLDLDRCRRHNDVLLDAAARSSGRLSAFCTVPLGSAEEAAHEIERCVAAGARGLGELRIGAAGIDHLCGALGGAIAEAAIALRLPVLIHASEPVGHRYPGKTGGPLTAIWEYLTDHPPLSVILAHLGGGLPFYAHMPEVRERFARVFVDTAATPWLYDRQVYRRALDLIGAERVLFGSDFPLRRPSDDLSILRDAGLSQDELALVLGGNAARLLELGAAR